MGNELEFREQIMERKAAYCRLLDTKEFDEWESLFKPDAKVVFYNPDDTVMAAFQSLAEYGPVARGFFAKTRTVHQVHHPEIKFPSETSATAVWPMADVHVYAPEGDQPSKTMHGYGFYHETWEQQGSEWKIASLELRRTVVQYA